jgi:hypothetical protein
MTRAIAEEMPFPDKIEVDENYFGGCWKRKRGQESAGKRPAFGVLEQANRAYTKVISDMRATTLMGFM